MTDKQLLKIYKSLYYATEEMHRQLVAELREVLPSEEDGAEDWTIRNQADWQIEQLELENKVKHWECRYRDALLAYKELEAERDAMKAQRVEAERVARAFQSDRDEWKQRAEKAQKQLALYDPPTGTLMVSVSHEELKALQADRFRLDWMSADVKSSRSLRNGMTLREHVDERMRLEQEGLVDVEDGTL